jgi:hypothetical protein
MSCTRICCIAQYNVKVHANTCGSVRYQISRNLHRAVIAIWSLEANTSAITLGSFNSYNTSRGNKELASRKVINLRLIHRCLFSRTA